MFEWLNIYLALSETKDYDAQGKMESYAANLN